MSTPGVYIEEIPTFPPSVAPVETAIPAFIGITKKTSDAESNTLIDVPKRITSLLEFEQIFGRSSNQAFAVDVVQEYSEEPLRLLSTKVTLTGSPPSPPSGSDLLYYAIQLFYANGGGPCYIVSAASTKFINAVNTLEEFDEPTIIASPGAVYEGNYADIINAALKQCNKLQDRVTVIDVPNDKSMTDIDTNFRTPILSDLSIIKYGAAYYPFLKTSYPFLTNDSSITITSHTVKILDSTGTDVTGTTSVTIPTSITGGVTLDDTTENIAQDFNSVYVAVKSYVTQFKVTLPPSSAVAGVYARVDNDRGVWKAPANVSISNIESPTIKVTNDFQDGLNIDPNSGKSINAIRTFTGRGTLVWGARTLAGNDNEWRYVPVRRFFNFAEESIKKATGRFVFEPNDKNTWTMVKTMIENFLILQWREGALAGEKPQHAFYVKVGLNQTMTAEDILNGFMNVEIGMAVVRPAEFIILKFSHKMQES
ncbi:phage tail sheath subtilisin-like domain-containing protein [Mangrovivirga sp. M17]|uniref:Phage tail sheath subtilisin-like domain-containing protein n=1 Tax=Mangrovivirga halotolerans TaxID=2993936 RepID=A0ABT3RQN8_9BACT|nr:phage tail sheath C-terminal domain-containing protein [Mangrovivirga halotolerans]MCX2743868.1 phage tail sheath subtilisin-like domain-containing protein [Mangrovivirga halotolerans]